MGEKNYRYCKYYGSLGIWLYRWFWLNPKIISCLPSIVCSFEASVTMAVLENRDF